MKTINVKKPVITVTVNHHVYARILVLDFAIAIVLAGIYLLYLWITK